MAYVKYCCVVVSSLAFCYDRNSTVSTLWAYCKHAVILSSFSIHSISRHSPLPVDCGRLGVLTVELKAIVKIRWKCKHSGEIVNQNINLSECIRSKWKLIFLWKFSPISNQGKFSNRINTLNYRLNLYRASLNIAFLDKFRRATLNRWPCCLQMTFPNATKLMFRLSYLLQNDKPIRWNIWINIFHFDWFMTPSGALINDPKLIALRMQNRNG